MVKLSSAAFSAALAAAVLAAGCARVVVPEPRPWDPDSEVLPLRLVPEEPQEEPAADPPLPSSYVLLLAEDDGNAGAVVVDAPEGEVVLDRQGVLDLDTMTILPPEVVVEPSPELTEALAQEPRAPVGLAIYFPINAAALTDESRRRLDEVLETLAAWPAAEVRLDAHGDRSGTPARNEELSKQRALAIRDLLLAAGVRPELIDVGWYGETQNAVPTPDGVREPRNRRVEIRIR